MLISLAQEQRQYKGVRLAFTVWSRGVKSKKMPEENKDLFFYHQTFTWETKSIVTISPPPQQDWEHATLQQ